VYGLGLRRIRKARTRTQTSSEGILCRGSIETRNLKTIQLARIFRLSFHNPDLERAILHADVVKLGSVLGNWQEPKVTRETCE
jgi:hypothetical protein